MGDPIKIASLGYVAFRGWQLWLNFSARAQMSEPGSKRYLRSSKCFPLFTQKQTFGGGPQRDIVRFTYRSNSQDLADTNAQFAGVFFHRGAFRADEAVGRAGRSRLILSDF